MGDNSHNLSIGPHPIRAIRVRNPMSRVGQLSIGEERPFRCGRRWEQGPWSVRIVLGLEVDEPGDDCGGSVQRGDSELRCHCDFSAVPASPLQVKLYRRELVLAQLLMMSAVTACQVTIIICIGHHCSTVVRECPGAPSVIGDHGLCSQGLEEELEDWKHRPADDGEREAGAPICILGISR